MNCIINFDYIAIHFWNLWKIPPWIIVNHHLMKQKPHKMPVNHHWSSEIHPDLQHNSPKKTHALPGTPPTPRPHRHIRDGRRAAQLSVGPAPVAEANHQPPGRGAPVGAPPIFPSTSSLLEVPNLMKIAIISFLHLPALLFAISKLPNPPTPQPHNPPAPCDFFLYSCLRVYTMLYSLH